MPVKSFTVAEPPRMSIEETIVLVESAKNMMTMCATLSQRARMISR